MSDASEDEGSAILSPELQSLMGAGGTDPLPVIIEVRAPRPQFDLTVKSGVRRIKGIVAAPDSDAEELRRNVRTITGLLRQATGGEPHYVPAARAFISRLRPEQITELAGAAAVSVIHLDAKLKRIR